MSRVPMRGFRADQLEAARRAADISQGELAARATAILRQQKGFNPTDQAGPSVSTATVSTWVRGTRSPSPDKLAATAAALDLPMSALIDVPADERTLRTLRELSGRTQPMLATEVGVSSGLLAVLERGHGNLTDDVGRRLAKALGLPVAEVVDAYNRGRVR
ncbi:helix-turn-helix transcriptional regulator [Nocardia sp. NPDC058518]|uniref:helix-turn-helix transcriptional regulator n=1 Tax=Nocardia sp. NPDC058518 TaxID=3346534 RepID=UPI003648FDD9